MIIIFFLSSRPLELFNRVKEGTALLFVTVCHLYHKRIVPNLGEGTELENEGWGRQHEILN